jgi:hypothetical protein
MDDIIGPGKTMLIGVRFPKGLDESEACHIDLFFEDFCKSLNQEWEIFLVGIKKEAKQITLAKNKVDNVANS